MTSQININGLSIKMEDGKLIIEGLGKNKQKDIVIDKNGNINGDVTGNIKVIGNDVTIVIEGDVTGNINGANEVQVKGDVIGNISK